MSITEIAIRRPVFLLMVIGTFIVFGIISFSRMGLSLIPDVDFPMVTVITVYPGANPEEIETSVTKPIEDAVSTVNGIDYIESRSNEGVSTVMVRMKLNINGDTARLDVQKKIDGILSTLPDDAETPTVSKLDISAQSIINIAVHSPQRPLNELYLIVDKEVKSRLQQVEGVADIVISGQKERQLNVTVDAERLAQHNLSVLDVIDVIKRENLDVPAGLVKTSLKENTVRVAGRIRNTGELGQLAFPASSGQELYLNNIARVSDGFKEMSNFSRMNGIDSLGIAVRRQPGTNIVQVINSVKQELERIKSRLPSDIVFSIAYDQSTFTQNSVNSVQNNLLEAIIVVGFIIFIFLRAVRNTIIILFAIPTSLIAAISLMYYSGFTFNMISMMGLATTIGILVDDAIVVLENIHRHLGMGKSPFQAALDGRNEIGLAAVSITLTDVAVFIPIAFMGGFVGKMFMQFGLTVTYAIIFSLFISFTLTPMLASRWLKSKSTKDSPEKTSKIMEFMKRLYGRISAWSLGHRKTVLTATAVIFLGSVALIPLGVVSIELMTESDRGELMVNITTPTGTSLEKTDRIIKTLESKIMAMPEVVSCFVTVGSASEHMASFSSNQTGEMKIVLRQGKKYRSTNEIAEVVRAMEKTLPGAVLRVSLPNMMSSSGGSDTPVQIEVRGTEFKDFNIASEMIVEAVRKIPGAIEVDSSWKAGAPEIRAEIDRVKCAALGIPAAVVGQTLRTSINGDTTNKYREGDREYDIMVTLPDARKKSLTDVSQMQVKSLAGEMVSLSQIARIYPDYGPVQIRRKDRTREFVVSANLAGRALGDVNQDINRALKNLKLPSTIGKITMGGETEMMEEVVTSMVMAMLLAILFVYMVMASLFESFFYPFVIMFALPITVVGAILGLMLTGNTLNLFSMIGVVMLIGLVTHNAILLIDYTNISRKRGLTVRDALIEAGKTRLRPILMTSLTLIFGMLPLALKLGAGSEMRAGMASVIMGGIISSTLLTLVFIPVVYSLMDDGLVWLKKNLHMRGAEINTDENLKPAN
ncbi:MAG: efflux RND transporter permease subunit [Planctomycetota bacterium]